MPAGWRPWSCSTRLSDSAERASWPSGSSHKEPGTSSSPRRLPPSCGWQQPPTGTTSCSGRCDRSGEQLRSVGSHRQNRQATVPHNPDLTSLRRACLSPSLDRLPSSHPEQHEPQKRDRACDRTSASTPDASHGARGQAGASPCIGPGTHACAQVSGPCEKGNTWSGVVRTKRGWRTRGGWKQ